MTNPAENPECCPLFDPALWDEKQLVWDEKLFIKSKVRCFVNMPLNFGSRMRKLVPLIERAGATMPDGMVLSEHTSMWKMYLYIAVDKGVSGIENVALSGNYFCKVYQGPYRDTGKWCRNFCQLGI
jgi:hypothetical protein